MTARACSTCFGRSRTTVATSPDDAIAELGHGLGLSPVEVRSTANYRHFFHDRPAGRHRLHLADTVVARMSAAA